MRSACAALCSVVHQCIDGVKLVGDWQRDVGTGAHSVFVATVAQAIDEVLMCPVCSWYGKLQVGKQARATWKVA